MIRPPGGAMPFPPVPVPPPRRPRALPAAAADKRRPPERPEGLLSSSWPSATLKRPPARRGPGPGPDRTQPPGAERAPPQPSPRHAATPAPGAAPRPGPGHSPAGTTCAGPDDAPRFSLSLTPEAVLVIQRRHLERQLQARPPADPRRPVAPGPRAAPGLRRAGPDATPAERLLRRAAPRAPPLPGGLPAPALRPRPADLRPVLKVSLLNERHKYDDVEYEDEPEALDEGLVRKCTEWLRGVQSAAAARDRAGHLDALPHLSTL